MIGAKLGLKAINRGTLGTSHDARIGDYHIERLAPRQKRIGAGAHAGE